MAFARPPHVVEADADGRDRIDVFASSCTQVGIDIGIVRIAVRTPVVRLPAVKAVFGKVVAGQDVVDKIAKVRTGRVGWYDDVPTEDVVIEKAEVI